MSRPDPGKKSSARFAFEGLDRAIHEKARLGILSSLVANPEGLVFSELKDLCDLTDGNLNRHMQVLEEAGLVEVWKGRRGNRPQTLVRLTETGRERFLEYIGLLEQIVANNIKAAHTDAARHAMKRGGPGWSPL
jgi:DNA-binding MarR family transcriptional regulator